MDIRYQVYKTKEWARSNHCGEKKRDNMDLHSANSSSKGRRGNWYSSAHFGRFASLPLRGCQQQHPCKGLFSVGT